MKLTDNVHILKWVDEMAALTKPDKILWIDGSEEQLEQLRQEAIGTGELIKLNEEKLPGCVLHGSDGDDVSVVKSLKVKGGGAIKIGTKVTNIRLLEDPVDGHDIDAKVPEIGRAHV